MSKLNHHRFKEADSEIIAEDEVTTENLEGLFKRAFFSAKIDEDERLVIGTESIRRIFVGVDEDRKLLKYMAAFGLKEEAPLGLKHAFVNRMNHRVIFPRFSVVEERSDVLIADYFLTFEGGILAFQIVSALRLFSRVVRGAISECDDDDLVE